MVVARADSGKVCPTLFVGLLGQGNGAVTVIPALALGAMGLGVAGFSLGECFRSAEKACQTE
jgi:hypothetical protein